MSRILLPSLLALAATLAATPAVPPAAAAGWQDNASSLLKGLTDQAGPASGVTSSEATAGLKEALRVGTDTVVDVVSAAGGYLNDADIHIPLPKSLQRVQSALQMVGMADLADDLEVRMNRAAEAAAPEARELFAEAIGNMTFDDAKNILNGPDDAATRFFQKNMTPGLTERFSPIVQDELAQAGAIASYDRMMSQYGQIPMVPDVKANLSDYAVEKALDGLFLMLAREEAAIRNNPAKQTTDLLRQVFGQ
ncbi:Protein of unknown function [Roseospirillum parvum]|uniref:DUF4197 domain-containing protein n=1 Tax=Roseospirillum parvum TaxID=83401 RepID=A0A1G7WPI9_9PROT|nr:DUF4197 domain-containing protein [Roseospirillum parvum]SDG73778.1 Protein of unknown function [Roseospirillum parvum]